VRGHGRCTADLLRGARLHGSGVSAYHDVRGKYGEQCLKRTAPRGREEGVHHAALATEIGGGRRDRALHPAAGAAGELPGRGWGAPHDGRDLLEGRRACGRVVRALLWATTHNLRTATRWASWAGQACGWLLIVAGLLLIVGLGLRFVGTGLFSGVWLVVLGWFLRSTAIHSYRRVVARDVLTGVPVGRLMHAPVPPIPADMTVSALVHGRLLGTEEQTIPVSEDGERLAGVVARVTLQDDAGVTLDDLASREVDQMPVVENGRLVGVLARRDIQRWLDLHGEQAARGAAAG
jgi:hypothetical protein